jgi:ubiquinone/menaquinone biosynthesis C-methylase UbiE
MSVHNRDIYEDQRTARHYGGMAGLSPAEGAALALVADVCRGTRILDLGVGGGRTTPYLLSMSSDYTGVDYADAMVRTCREKYPGVRFELGDARELDQFDDASFDFVLFSFNGMDYVLHADRLRILSAVHRVLSGNGVFVFSSHNAAFDRKRHYSPPLRIMATLHDLIDGCLPRGRRRVDADDRVAYRYRMEKLWNVGLRLRTYYIAAADQLTQLARHGFRCDAIISMDGSHLSGACDTVSPWIYYVARKVSR